MELLFIDESGDDGLAPKSSEFYILSGVAVEDIFWKETFWKLSRFRKSIVQKYGLKIDEIKGENIFQHEGPLYNSGLLPNDQKWICESFVELIHKELQIEIFLMAKSKEEFLHRYPMPMRNLTKIFREEIWQEYLSHYEESLIKKSQMAGRPQTGMIFYDKNQEKHVRSFIRRFTRKFDEHREYPGAGLIEDVLFYNSRSSFFIQLADFLASVSLRIVRGKSLKDAFEISQEMNDKLQSKIGAFMRK